MHTVFNPNHSLHSKQVEFLDGRVIPSFESPDRMELILTALCERGFPAPVIASTHEPMSLGLAHNCDYLRDLESICADIEASSTSLLPATWPTARGRVLADHPPQIRLGRWARDTFSSVGRGTYRAAAASVDCVLSALDYVIGGGAAAFALSRPPHHHAGRNYLNGYCYLNGTATAALQARARGLRCAVLDIDYHHGNGTQDILYDTDVLFCSIHGQPNRTFPFFSGYANECGASAGKGYTFNLPLAHGTGWSEYANALCAAVRRIVDYGPDLLIVSLGVDTYCGDPVGRFRLHGDDFSKLGAVLARIAVPTVFAMEGGYAVDALGTNVANVLCGWKAATRHEAL